MLPEKSNTEQLYVTQDVEAFEGCAEDLMDQLFEDVEHILSVNGSQLRAQVRSGGGKSVRHSTRSATGQLTPVTMRHANPAAQIANPAQTGANASGGAIVPAGGLVHQPRKLDLPGGNTVHISKIDLPSLPLPPISQQDIFWMGSPLGTVEPEQSPYDFGAEAGVINPERPAYQYFIDRFLMGAACASVMLAGLLWAVDRGVFGHNPSFSNANHGNVAALDSPEKSEFVEEIKESFSAIDTQKTLATNPAQTTPTAAPGAIPTAAVRMNPALATNGQVPVAGIQPVYIPVYQPPGVPVANPAMPGAIAPGTPTSILPPAANADPQTMAAMQQPQIQAQFTLVGVLELGDRSTAMIDNGVTVERVRVGESISGSRWLVSRISQQEIRLKQGNQYKTIAVGQKF
ncbi:hypothetical protein Pse7367_3220 [Thalassoporum mexicanum PCC 7367]|uniref:hypothetical protein n=1 Tax=Thalassoporum mexicanum TaxID=3457544 RepID=UPI00029FA6B4|nr:hypothetical protein [Pseudanabaena sp. PCC 7367]AFY71465.1 hypothetical protein Pse7367_3220 [Pseudanabaena sp. PCC 7367]